MSQEYFQEAIYRKEQSMKYDISELQGLLSRLKDDIADEDTSREHAQILHSRLVDFAEVVKELEMLHSTYQDSQRWCEIQAEKTYLDEDEF